MSKFHWRPYGDGGVTAKRDGITYYVVKEPWGFWEWHRVSDDPTVRFPDWPCAAQSLEDAVQDCEDQMDCLGGLPMVMDKAKGEVAKAGWDWEEIEAALRYCLTPKTKVMVLLDVIQMASDAEFEQRRGEAIPDVHRRIGLRDWERGTVN